MGEAFSIDFSPFRDERCKGSGAFRFHVTKLRKRTRKHKSLLSKRLYKHSQLLQKASLKRLLLILAELGCLKISRP